MSVPFASPEDVMRHAIKLARRGEGYVEPNPMVGSVLVNEQLELLAEGFHQVHGEAHAEVNALADFAQRVPDEAERRRLLATATLYVTLEPCCHHGKTPPCSELLINSGVKRVIVGMRDPFPRVNGGGIQQLQDAGVEVQVGLLQDEVERLNAPFIKLVTSGLPYVHAKWAMTLDGKIATRTGESQWISNEDSRALVHELRGRVDAIIVGAGTARTDDPLLTARPAGPRVAARVIFDSRAKLSLESQLVKTAREVPLIVVCGSGARWGDVSRLRNAGAEVLQAAEDRPKFDDLLDEFGRRRMTNILIEGGSELLGHAFDRQLIDEVHVFVAPKLVGGKAAPSPVGGEGLEHMPQIDQCELLERRPLGDDIYLRMRVLPIEDDEELEEEDDFDS